MAGLDERMYVRMSAELVALVEQQARELGIDKSEWVRQAIVSHALLCQALDLAADRPLDLRDPATLARVLSGS